MVAINPKTLKVIAQITLPEMIGGRITTTVYNGKDEIYLPGATKLYRYTYRNGSFALDSSWGPIPYLKSGQTPGSAMAVMGNYVVTMTNGQPTSTPMSVIAVSQAARLRRPAVLPYLGRPHHRPASHAATMKRARRCGAQKSPGA